MIREMKAGEEGLFFSLLSEIFSNVLVSLRENDRVAFFIEEDKPVAFIHWQEKERVVILRGLGVKKGYRKKGIASRLLSYFLSLIDGKRKPVFLKVKESNPAIFLYKSFGFRIIKKREGVWVMRRDPLS